MLVSKPKTPVAFPSTDRCAYGPMPIGGFHTSFLQHIPHLPQSLELHRADFGLALNAGPCGLNVCFKLCFMANHLMISLNKDLMLVVAAGVGPHRSIQLCSTAGNGKSPYTNFLPTERAETFFLFSALQRGRTQCESVVFPWPAGR